ncbi:MAG: HdeA/HdeB family chaperone [Desulfovibrionaceae bacterium]
MSWILILLFLMAAPVYAKPYNVNISCNQLELLPPEVVGQVCYWWPGWWSAQHGDPHINAMRVILLTNAVTDACTRNQSSNILSTVRAVPSLPSVPDNGLTYTCPQFLNSGEQWQYMHVLWLQGYMAWEDGSTMIEADLTPVVEKAQKICTASSHLNMEAVGRRLFLKKKYLQSQ